MKKSGYVIGSICGAALLLAGGMAQAQQVLSQNVVGYYNITVNQGLNLVAFPFQKIPAAQGIVTANDATTITMDGAGWAADFGYVETGESTFYVEIKSGVFEGRHMYIDTHTADTLTIAGGLPADIGAGELAGEAFKIVAANRVRDLLGEPGDPVMLGAGGAADADNVLTWNGTGWDAPIYYKTSGFPPDNVDNWNRGSDIVNDLVIDRDEAVFVRSRGADAITLTVVGEVSGNNQQIVLSQGLNLVGGLSVVNEVIGESTLTQTLAGGSGAADADNILPWMGTGWETPIYYKTSGFPPDNVNKWNQGSTVVDDTFAFSPSHGYFMRVRGAAPLGTWVRTSPLAQ